MARVSIGLPVYNGETFVAGAVESLLSQTLSDFELAIVDNASTDRTGEICRSFAARDSRVRYHRNERNLGLAPNWNLAYELAGDAPYFKWAAHDDIHTPTFLERCVAVLDADPTAVLAHSRTGLIDQSGQTIENSPSRLPLDSPDPAVRFHALMPSDRLVIFGVMRREVLLGYGKPVIGNYVDHDGVLLLRLALAGRFLEIPEVLFLNRRHASQAESRFSGNGAAWTAWLDPSQAGKLVFPAWRKQAELWKSLIQAPLSGRDRLRCARVLARWLVWTRHRLYRDVAYNVNDLWQSVARPRREDGGAGAS
jgi:glycosyltransferase involved in cell wall biosynthesis